MKRSLRLLCLLLCCTLLGGCGRSVEVPTFAPLPETAGLRVAVASDLHLNPDYTDTRVDPGAASYNLQLTEALLWDAREQGASLMLSCPSATPNSARWWRSILLRRSWFSAARCPPSGRE